MTATSLFRREALEHRRDNAQAGVPLPPAPPPAWLAWSLLACVAAGLTFVAAASYARKEHVVGYLAPMLGVARVAPQRAGRVTLVHVRDGELVAADAPLITIQTGAVDAGGADVDAAMLSALQRQRDRVVEQVSLEQAHLGQARARLSDHIASLSSEFVALQAELRLQSQRAQSTAQQVEATRGLVATGNLSRIEFQRREDAALAQQQAGISLTREIAGKQGEIEGDRHALAALPDETAARVAALRAQAAEIETRIAETQGQRATLLRAPIAGRVSSLQVRAGQAADPAIPLLAIVPEGDALRAELLVPARAIGEIRAGQPVRVAYDAFPAARFGLHAGQIETVSNTLLRPAEVTGPILAASPCYRVTVTLDRQAVGAGAAALPLAADMTLSAEIVIDRRSLLDWLLAPLRDPVRAI